MWFHLSETDRARIELGCPKQHNNLLPETVLMLEYLFQLVSTEGSSVSDNKSQGAAERTQEVESVCSDVAAEKVKSSDDRSNSSRF